MKPYYLDDRLAQALGMFTHGPCPLCGRPLFEDAVPGGTMFRCFPVAEQGEQPEEGDVVESHFFYAWAP